MKRVLAMAQKELKQLARDARTLLALVALPALLLLLYGYVLSFDVERVALAVVDRDGSAVARELIWRFTAGETFRLAAVFHDLRAADQALDLAQAQAILVIPEDFSKKLAQGTPQEVQFIVDGTDARIAAAVLGYAQTITSTLSFPATPSPRLTSRPVIWFNPNLRSSIFLVPGLLAFVLMLTTVVATALSVAREVELGTMESLRATPLEAWELILGKTLPYLLVSSLAASFSLAVALWLFRVPFRGAASSAIVVILLFLLGGLGWGLLISTWAETQQVAFQQALLTTLLPSLLLSGFIFPISSMPKAVQWLTAVIPARYFLVALRGVVLKGGDLGAYWEQVLALFLFALATLGLATVRLRRKF